MRMAIIKKSGGGGGGAVGTAKPPDVLAGKTFSNDEGTGLVGTMPNQGKKDFTPGKTPQTIPAGYHNGQGVVDSLGGDAGAEHVLEGKTFSSDIEGRAVNGTMPDQGAMIITPTRTGVIIPAGYHNGQGVVVGDPNFEAGNIKEGVEIWGVVGTLTPDSPPAGDAAPDDVIAGKTFESAVAGAGAVGTLTLTGNATAEDILENKTCYTTDPKNQVIGSMVDRGAVIITPGTSNKPIPKGYHNGAGYVKGDSNLVSDNIVEGISIFGVNGRAKRVVTGSFSIYDETTKNIEIGFKAKLVLCLCENYSHWAVGFFTQNNEFKNPYDVSAFRITAIGGTYFTIRYSSPVTTLYGTYWAFKA